MIELNVGMLAEGLFIVLIVVIGIKTINWLEFWNNKMDIEGVWP